MPVGEELRQARLRRKQTCSQVAQATHMKVQIVEALEREDFSRIAAPIYAKGFIKLYAEYVGLRAKPLMDEYVSRFLDAPPTVSVVAPEKKDAAAPAPATSEKIATPPASAPTGMKADGEESEKEMEPRRWAPAAARDVARTPPREVPPEEEKDAEEEDDVFDRVDAPPEILTGKKKGVSRPEKAPEPSVARELPRLSMWVEARESLRHMGAWATRVRTVVGRVVSTAVGAGGRKLADVGRDLGSKITAIRDGKSPAKTVSVMVAVALLLVFVISGISRCVRLPGRGESFPERGIPEELRVAIDPSPPYVD